jgi:hypothetical protein
MSMKSKVLGAATALALAGAVAGTLPAGTAVAATGSCGPRCVDLFSRQAGTHRHPGLVLDVLRREARVGQPVVLSGASRKDPGEDFTVSFEGRVSDFYSAGLVTTWLARHYGGGCRRYRPATGICRERYPNDYAYEIQYAPLGMDSGLCAGLPSAAAGGTAVSLQPCGTSARTVWVVDLPNSGDASMVRGYAPLINASQAAGPRLYVLTYPPGSRRLATHTLERTGRRGTVIGGQQWGANFGPIG